MSTGPVKILGGQSEDTLIRPSDSWADRAAPVLFACACLVWAGEMSRDMDKMPAARVAESAMGLWLMFAVWLVVFALTCARIVWTFLGVTRISVSSEELVVRRCVAGDTITTSGPITLSTIRDVRLEERETRFKGNLCRRWALIVLLNDGSERHVVSFRSGFAANEFLSRFVR